MASHFSSIGLPVKSNEDMKNLLSKALERGEKLFCDYGHYSKWTSITGAELWIHVDNSNEIIGVNPFYHGSSNFNVGIVNRIEKEEYNDFEGLFYAWANPSEDDIELGDYNFAFDCVNNSIINELRLPCIKKVKLSAFAHELTIYSNENDYHSKQTKKPYYATKSFIPSGLFSPDDNENEPFEIIPEAIFTGIILEYNNFVNELTNEKYYWIKTETYGGIIDVVVDPKFVKTDLQINGIISGVFYLCGKILD